MVGLQASFSDCSIPRLCRLLLCTLPCPSCCYNPCHSYHTTSSAHLVVPRLRPSISVCQTRSFAHMGISRLCPIIPTTHHVLPLPFGSGSYCVPISPPILLPLASRESSWVAQSFFSFAYWRHHASLLHPPYYYPVSLAYTSNKGRSTTHCTTVACRLSM